MGINLDKVVGAIKSGEVVSGPFSDPYGIMGAESVPHLNDQLLAPKYGVQIPGAYSDMSKKELFEKMWMTLSSPLRKQDSHEAFQSYQSLLLMRKRLTKHRKWAAAKARRVTSQWMYFRLFQSHCQSIREEERDRSLSEVSVPGIKVEKWTEGIFGVMLTKDVMRRNNFVETTRQGYEYWIRKDDQRAIDQGRDFDPDPAFDRSFRVPSGSDQSPTWDQAIERGSYFLESFDRDRKKARLTDLYVRARADTLQAILYQFELHGEVAETPDVEPPKVTPRSREYYEAAARLTEKSFKSDNPSEYFKALAKRAPKPNGEFPTWQAVNLWARDNGHYETNANLSLSEVKNSIENTAAELGLILGDNEE